MFPLANVSQVENTPVVVEGVMYVSSANECYALDAGSGRMIWHFQRPRTKGLAGNAAIGFNRGVAAAGDRIFMLTDNAHIIALDRFNGQLMWEIEMADWHQNYNGTIRPASCREHGGLRNCGRRRGSARLCRGLRPVHR
jgi:alcohol dehydrogenase (cytochrome c)